MVSSEVRKGVALGRLETAIMRERVAKDRVESAVVASLAEGATWREIGEALGVTRQAAAERFGRRISIRRVVEQRGDGRTMRRTRSST